MLSLSQRIPPAPCWSPTAAADSLRLSPDCHPAGTVLTPVIQFADKALQLGRRTSIITIFVRAQKRRQLAFCVFGLDVPFSAFDPNVGRSAGVSGHSCCVRYCHGPFSTARRSLCVFYSRLSAGGSWLDPARRSVAAPVPGKQPTRCSPARRALGERRKQTPLLTSVAPTLVRQDTSEGR